MKCTTIIGARPQFIKAFPVSKALTKHGIEETIVHTGQHYDDNMSDIFWRELDLKPSQYNLNISGGTHGDMTGRMLIEIDKLLNKHRADFVIVYGDTNSTLAAALAASKLHIPIVHIEAGLRSYNRLMPEEINRVTTDHLSTLLFCPSEESRQNLQKEGITKGAYVVGDVMNDASSIARNLVKQNPPNNLYEEIEDFALCTIHREENTNKSSRLREIFEAIGRIDKMVIFPIHPRTKKLIAEYDIVLPKNIKTTPPVGYLEMTSLIVRASHVITDSGGLQKEAYWAQTPCITMRTETEWVETLEGNWNQLIGENPNHLITAISSNTSSPHNPQLYGDGNASDNIADIITRRLSI